MTRSPTPPPPYTRSPSPRSYANQSRLDSATAWILVTAWLLDSNRTASNCPIPIPALVHIIETDSLLGAATLSKYDTGPYALRHNIERAHLIDDMRLDVSARSGKDNIWRGVMDMADRTLDWFDRERTAPWARVGSACMQALEVTQRMREKLEWWEREERVWDEGSGI